LKLKNFFVLLLSVFVFFSIGFSMVASADDDEQEDDEREEQQIVTPIIQPIAQPVVQSVIQPEEKVQDEKVTKPKIITKKITDPPTKVIVNELRNFELSDSDLDGLIDAEDPHPEKPEIYLVKDDNNNGIVDTFENYVTN
jgi:hypothetical protein